MRSLRTDDVAISSGVRTGAAGGAAAEAIAVAIAPCIAPSELEDDDDDDGVDLVDAVILFSPSAAMPKHATTTESPIRPLPEEEEKGE